MADRKRLPRMRRLHHLLGHQRAIREKQCLGREDAVEKGNDAAWNGDDDDDGGEGERSWDVFAGEIPMFYSDPRI